MKEGCTCGIDWGDLARANPPRDLGLRKLICPGCGKEFYTDIKDKTHCFECEKKMPCKK